MASAQGPQVLAERVDIHKSCKSLETLLNVLNDYCEAAGAVVLLQKKLVKALHETANLKVTGEIAANAMNASATIFDALSDIDSKFAKIADKEYDAISAEVKKWFKKLAKEEKAHDDRLSSANAKIKQAGLIYEKKSKKNPRDSADEHARYINLISSLGPEISQEKYNHTLQVTQRHASTTYSVAACVSRVADAEWLRTCEGVRRFSPTIGPLGEWRALCEGGWTGPFPPPLVDPDPDPEQSQTSQEAHGEDAIMRNLNPTDNGAPAQSFEHGQSHTASPFSSPNPPRASLPYSNQSLPPSSFEPPRPLVDPNSGSVRSLSAFPPPPTHFPIPSVSPRQQQSQQASSSSSASNPNLNFPAMRQDDSTLLEHNRQVEEPSSLPPSPNLAQGERRPAYVSSASVPPQREDLDIKRPIPVRSQTVDPYQPNHDRIPSPPASGSMRTYARGDYLADERAQSDVQDAMRSKNGIERSDTGGSTGSVVAAMRNRYSYTSGASSPPPKDIPRLPLSVSDLATRYQPMDAGPVSPRNGAVSPPVPSSRTPLPASPDRYAGARHAEGAFGDRNTPGGYNPAWSPMPSPSTSRPTAEEDAARRRNQPREQRIDEAAELEFLEKEKALRDKEREIGLRAQELEVERANLRNARVGENQQDAWETSSPMPPLRPRERKTSFRNVSPLPRPQSQLEPRSPPPSNVGNNHAYSHSTTHLVPPSQSPSSPRSSTSSADGARAKDHAPYCGCETCSVAQYKSASNRSPSPNDLRPPEKPFSLRPEKPKGWIRRLSMPAVGNAFSLDKKSTGKMYSLDGNKRNANGSATTLRTVHEDGRLGQGRRSYDASGTSNRSMTSLVAGGRR
ncbi:hypothetical protein B0H15DRAFT_808473 [Mycena belliarum]|uniref:Uncharacterized protein n=1 Tax=Mycena belliarum TaxID=1033014 RepID=A0AAD6XZY3_9AGAR|nr:hypothetical protein B0H15DRAFT_808473 [Mycena belliae]